MGKVENLERVMEVIVDTTKGVYREQIVRCKDCRHWCCHNDVDYDQSKFTYYCEIHGISFEGDDYCSFGERKESE